MGKLTEHRAFLDGANNLWVDCKIVTRDGVETPFGPVVSEEELAELRRKHEAARSQNTPDGRGDG